MLLPSITAVRLPLAILAGLAVVSAAPGGARAEPTALDDPLSDPIVVRSREPDRIEWLRLRSDVGFQHLTLRTLLVDESLDAEVVPETLTGPTAALGVGAKLWFLSLGVVARKGWLEGAAPERGSSGVELRTIDAEVAVRAPLGRVEPHVDLAVGYATLAGGPGAPEVDGLALRAGLGVDVYLRPWLSLDARVGAAALVLTRAGVSASELLALEGVDRPQDAGARLVEADGSAVGLAIDAALGLGVHF